MSDKYIVIVDPYYNHLVDELLSSGVKLIAVFSDYAAGDELLNIYPLDLNKFSNAFTIKSDDELDVVVDKLRNYEVIGVANGLDKGASLWVKLSNSLGMSDALPIESCQYLTDKFKTLNALRGKGVPVANNQLISEGYTKESVSDVAKKIKFPMVIKPTNSASSFGVRFCEDIRELHDSVQEIMGVTDVYGEVVREIAAEEMLIGTEYAVCTISKGGKHKVVAVYKYSQYEINGIRMVKSLDLARPEDAECEEAMSYARSVLEALSYVSGPTVTEVIVTGSGARLVEVNPRVGGIKGLLDVMTLFCMGESHVSATRKQLSSSTDDFDNIPDIYSPTASGSLILLENSEPCTVSDTSNIQKIKNLSSSVKVSMVRKMGDYAVKTIDCNTIAGYVVLCNKSREQFEKDKGFITSLEKNGLYAS